MGKFFTDYERLEWVKKWKISKLNMTEFARKNGLAYSTFRDWVYAYQNLEGSFVRIDPNIGNGYIGTKDDVVMNMLTNESIYKASKCFTRFDHSIVVIEYKELKVTTSLEQALVILEKLK